MSLLIYTIIIGGIYAGLTFLLPKAGYSKLQSAIPVYNVYLWLKAAHKPWWWLFLLAFPGVNVLMVMIMSVNLGTVFGKRTPKDVWLNALFPFVMLPLLGLNKDTKYVGPIDRKKFKKTQAQEWRDAILFAVVTASIVRTYFLEAFTIPTSSMEKSMLVGDFLFVSKMAYGPKVPQVPLALPFAHHTLPLTTSTPSYLEWIKLPYMRLPGFGEVKRNDVVVFNFPAGDTVVLAEQERAFEQIARDQAYVLRETAIQRGENLKSFDAYFQQAKELVLRTRETTVRPVDKREHYIKRCVAVPGDTLKIENTKLLINGEMAYMPEEMQYSYYVATPDFLNRNVLKEEVGIAYSDQQKLQGMPGYIMPLTFDMYDKINAMSTVVAIEPTIDASGMGNPTYPIFPNHPNYSWTEDNFGPIIIPKAGESVELTAENLPIYRRIITAYEGHALAVKDGVIYIDGQATNSYTFGMNYYFMMGDNRHNSADSRFWGFVPENHIVGKGSFVWLSLDKELGLLKGKIRWNRFFKAIE